MTFNPANSPVLAVDIGGTKTAFGVIDPGGRLVREAVIPTPRGNATGALGLLLDTAHEVATGLGVGACGVDIPAVVADGVVEWAAWSFPGWDGLPIAELFRRSLGIPCVLEFDGYAAALGEFWQGRARGYHDAVVVIVGTGVGAGFIHGGKLYRGSNGVAGAIGWLRLPDHAELGPTLEEVASGSAILRRARAAHPRGEQTYADTAAVFDAADAGDPVAGAVVREALTALSAGVGALVATLAPEMVVLGGGVGARADVVREVRRQVLGSTQPFAARNLIVDAADLGSRSSLFGAGYLAHCLIKERED
jgi:glucokinase